MNFLAVALGDMPVWVAYIVLSFLIIGCTAFLRSEIEDLRKEIKRMREE